MMMKFGQFLVLGVVLACAFVTHADARENAQDVRISFSDAIKRVSPAVVNIFTEKVVAQRTVSPFFNDPFFQHFFGNQLSGPMRKRVESSLGSGVIVTPDGYMVTNYHVVKDAQRVKVVFDDRREVTATFVNADPNMDLAIMKLESEEPVLYPFAEFGDSDSLEVGDVVLAIGNPYGVGQSVSMGIVSALGRSNLGTTRYENYIQTDAAINPGNSGGALIDSSGKVVGINTAIYSKSGGSQGIGFAMPAKSVNNVLTSILETGKVTRPWFGAGGQDLTVDLAEQLGLDVPNGVLLNEIDAGGPAQTAGLQVGDIITGFDGQDVNDTGMLTARVAGSPIDENLDVEILRGGEKVTLPIRLRALPDRRESDQHKLTGSHPLSGYVVEELSPALNDEIGLPLGSKGVAVVGVPVNSGVGFFGINLKAGDILLAINKKEIKTVDDVKKALERRAGQWRIAYQRGGRTYRVVMQ